MRLPTQQEKDSLESLIDSMNLDTILGAIVNICYEKANHIEANLQDRATAKVWDGYGKAVAKAQHFVESH